MKAKSLLLGLLCFFVVMHRAKAQTEVRPYQTDERRWFTNIGVGTGIFKAGNAYTLSPLLITNTRLGWQMYVSEEYLASKRLNIGLKVGGIFRPKFDDQESNSVIQPKFTPWALAYTDYYLGALNKRTTWYVGVGAGATHIGQMEARHNDTRTTYMLRRRDRDVFLTIVPRIGLALGEFKIQGEYFVTTPFNPDFISLTLMGTIPTGKRKYY